MEESKKILLVDKNKINIKEENIKGFTESIGKTYIMFGIFMLITLAIGLTDNNI